jgi:uncharacterized protein (TIGR03118 family)
MPFPRSIRPLAVTAAVLGGLALAVPTPAFASGGPANHHNGFAVSQVNLVSDQPGAAALLDPDLVNPWGLAASPTSPLWAANNGTDTSTLYTSAPGSGTATKVAAVRVTFPDKPELATGQVFNGGTGFVNTLGAVSGPARFIFSTLTGHIEAWAPGVDPNLGVVETRATVPGAAYTGLALATATAGAQLYASNFAQNRIDVFDGNFNRVHTSPFAFRDFFLPRGFNPFNVQALNGNLFVTYAKIDPKTGRDVPGAGLGFVDEFTPNGKLVARIASRQSLNAPWGVAVAPASWGSLAGALLIGNFGDGTINVVAPSRYGSSGFQHRIEGQVRNSATGKVLVIHGLWMLLNATATNGGADSLWFSAGPGGEKHGLLGLLNHP